MTAHLEALTRYASGPLIPAIKVPSNGLHPFALLQAGQRLRVVFVVPVREDHPVSIWPARCRHSLPSSCVHAIHSSMQQSGNYTFHIPQASCNGHMPTSRHCVGTLTAAQQTRLLPLRLSDRTAVCDMLPPMCHRRSWACRRSQSA